MPEPLPLSAAGTPRRGRPRGRGKTFRIGLDVGLCAELERAAERGINPEVLLNAVGRVVVRDHLIDAVLDDRPDDAAG